MATRTSMEQTGSRHAVDFVQICGGHLHAHVLRRPELFLREYGRPNSLLRCLYEAQPRLPRSRTDTHRVESELMSEL